MRGLAGGTSARRIPFGQAASWTYAIVFYAVLYGPLVMIVILSFNDSEIIGFPFNGWTMRWYARIAESPVLIKALANSFAVGAIAATIATFFALLLSFAFRSQFVGKTLVFNLILLPIIVPGIVAGIMLLIFFGYLGVRPNLCSPRCWSRT